MQIQNYFLFTQVRQKSNIQNTFMLVSSKYVSSISVQCLSGNSREPNGIVGYNTPKNHNIIMGFGGIVSHNAIWFSGNYL